MNGMIDLDRWNERTARYVATMAWSSVRHNGQVELLRFGSNGVYVDSERHRVIRVSPRQRYTSSGYWTARALADLGVSVVRPDDPAPTLVLGHDVTFWPYVTPSERPVDFEQLGADCRLAHNHAAQVRAVLDTHQVDQRRLRDLQLDKISDRLEFLRQHKALDSDMYRRLKDIHTDLCERWPSDDSDVIVHGDMHPGNVLVDDSGQYLIDFDQASLGPRAWDVVPLINQQKFYRTDPAILDAFVAGYGADPRLDPGVQVMSDSRALSNATWITQLALTERSLLPEAIKRLRFWLDGNVPEPWVAY